MDLFSLKTMSFWHGFNFYLYAIMLDKISLTALRFFYQVAICQSVTLASQKLFVTQSAVSKQIKNLEDSLNVALFDRVNNRLILNDKGQQLFDCCQLIFAKLDNCLHELQAEPTPSKPLIVSCEPTLSMKWLIPRLTEFHQAQHGFEIVLLTAGGAIDFAKTPADVALRRNDFAFDKAVYYEKLANEYLVPIALAHSEPTTWLLSSSRPSLAQNLEAAQKTLLLEHFYLCIEACLAGLGATFASIYMVEKELKNQTFVPIKPPFTDHSAYYLLSPRPFAEDSRKQVFLTWLQAEMATTQQQILQDFGQNNL